jgi:hypothetical protein
MESGAAPGLRNWPGRGFAVHLALARAEEVVPACSHELAGYPGILERLGLAGVHLGALRGQGEDRGLGAVRVS